MRASAWAWSALVYIAVTVVLGRDVLAQLGSVIVSDPGDPLLTAAILHWNASHVPFADRWWQFPIYYPTRDALAFSEHLLGLSAIAAPITWSGANALAAYNITLLATFVLSAVAMHVLVYRLTGDQAAGFIAGLAYGFAPYRMSNLPHIQMLATFWAPLALLGLHGFVQTKRWRWLALYSAAWALQGAANGYMLVFFSVLVALWVIWFVIVPRRWADLPPIAAATALALLPLLPIVLTYVDVHAAHGFTRGVGETRGYSADVAAVLCARGDLAFWGWVRVACRAEGELFPGAALFAVNVAAVWWLLRSGPPASPIVIWVRRVLLALALAYALVIASFWLGGPWRLELGALRLSVSSVDKPLLVALVGAVGALLVSLGRHAVNSRLSTPAFYLFAAVLTWLFALGPTVTLMGESSGRPGPFVLIQSLPGVAGLRVPARFWSLTVCCLCASAGLMAATILARLRARPALTPARSGVLAILACGVLADGWLPRFPIQQMPPPAPDPALLRGQVVLQLPMDAFSDVAALWRAVMGGWRTVNGYSGYGPNYYTALTQGAASADAGILVPFQSRTELHVIVADTASELRAMIERQAGATMTGRGGGMTQYRLPKRPSHAAATHVAGIPPAAARLPVARVMSDCAATQLPFIIDGDETTRWECLAAPRQHVVTLELASEVGVGSLVYSLGPYSWNVPAALDIETSLDGVSWSTAHTGSIIAELVEGGLANSRSLRAHVAFEPRRARYVRVRARDSRVDFAWWICELEIHGPGG